MSKELRHIFLNLRGEIWYYGEPVKMPDGSTVYFNPNNFVFDQYERGFMTDAELIRYLQTTQTL